MKIEFWNIGRDKYPFVSEAVALYSKRIKKHLPFEMVRYEPKKKWKNLSGKELIQAQSRFFAETADPRDCIVLLDESGKKMESVPFARWINNQMVHQSGTLIFICGGSYGIDRSAFNSVRNTLSLSSMTMSHQIIRIVFMEQLYRALSILKNEPYHH